MGGGLEDFEIHEIKSKDGLKHTTGKNVNIKGTAGEVSERSETRIAGNGRKGSPGSMVANVKLNCVLQLCGKQNMQIMNLDI